MPRTLFHTGATCRQIIGVHFGFCQTNPQFDRREPILHLFMISKRILPANPRATLDLGAEISSQVSAGDLITLSGPLGAGKTTFAQGLARGLGVPGEVRSPTFVLVIEYQGRLPLVHLDAYRLEAASFETLRDAGIDELLLRTDAVKLVEWPEMIAPWLGPAAFALTFELLEEGGREVTIRRASAG